ncbi:MULTISPECIES: pilus assembly protein TadG-related protein [Micromonosporaceae]|uniref:pilus assembly protein TadG-related protein n=1 Tax=Micromonosporaceae TaxID=28056 RepID=UPI00039DC124|nr:MULTISPECIES: pilus assembly protein TadG-related protein [Micromonosporaceae]MDG4793102.1 pilus assembly protein TadG-related protein [Micromonospora sp. WMMD1082]SCL36214.1 Putative Flp pilus-assembly TadE/G-like [Micromonospora aurantiaca]
MNGRRCAHPPTGRDAGRIGLFYAIVLPGLIAMIGLAGDGAGYVRTTQRAHNIAAEAARAGGQAIRLPEAINGETKAVDTTKAIDAVGDYLTTAGISEWQATVDDDGQQLTVTVTVHYDPLLVDVLPGVTTIPAHATVTATLLVG